MKTKIPNASQTLSVRILSAQKPESEDHNVRCKLGDHLSWFQNLLCDVPNVRMTRVLRDGLPRSVDEQVIIMPGSAYSPKEILDKLPDYPEFLRQMQKQGKLFLLVCSGHQVFAEALGGHCVKNPMGPELGTTSVTIMTDAEGSILFDNIPRVFKVSSLHYWTVLRLPNLGPMHVHARSAKDAHQIVQYGDHLSMQFHPEINSPLMRSMLISRKTEYFGNNEDAYEHTMEAVEDTPYARILVSNWLNFVVTPRLVRAAQRTKPRARNRA